jgi:GNAT superfamily N-acetyltransferase
VPDTGADAAGHLAAAVTRRWEGLDPLLPPPGSLPPGCGVTLGLTRPDGGPAAAASCEHQEHTSGSLESTWGAAYRFKLTAHVAGTDVAHGLDALLSRWREHLAGVPTAHDTDSSAVVTWPSRDVTGVSVLRRHGLTPLAEIAARLTGDRSTATPAASGGVRIRRAGTADLDAVVALGLETIRYDSHFGAVGERPHTADALRREAAGVLADDEPWVWLAERDGRPVAMRWLQQPGAAAWIAPMTRVGPVAYGLLSGTASGARGQGVGTALADHVHREIAAAGVAVTLAHHALPNPLSVPFWHRQGYRPLWTVWEARPAAQPPAPA